MAKGDEVVHVAPPAERVPGLINDLLGWLDTTEHHPLIAGGVMHYELGSKSGWLMFESLMNGIFAD